MDKRCFIRNFSVSYSLLRAFQQAEFRDDVKRLCNWGSDGEFSMKKNGKRNISQSDWDVIVSLFYDYGIDVVNEEIIT